MKTMTKTIAFLIESELEKAEVVLAARSISDALQKMTETAAKMEAEDLMPMVDPIREYFGPEASKQFSDAVTEKLRHLVEVLSETKNAVSDEIARLQGEEIAPSNDLSNMEVGDLDADEAEEPTDDDAGDELDFDDMMDTDGVAETPEAPRFSDEQIAPNAAGRVRKESVETGDRMIIREYIEMIQNGKTPNAAVGALVESYGIDTKTMVSIITSGRA